MPRLETFKLTVHTGEQGPEEQPTYSINGFPLDFDAVDGSTEPGEEVELVGHPQSYPHTLTLTGPRDGCWMIEGIEVEYRLDGEEPYTVRLGPVTLDDESDLNIWHERPAAVFDV